MTCFFLVGEASGDLHASRLVQDILRERPTWRCVGFGGDEMERAGCTLVRHYRHLAFMGVRAVVEHWRDVRDNFRIAREALLSERPDVLVLVDYPSFNLRMAAFARKHLPGVRIIYYIPPKIWAWKRWRVHRIARLCDEVLGIFPFEPAFYARYGYACTYVGNPTAESLRPLAEEETERTTCLLVPGSRRSEIAHCLPRMIAAARVAMRRTGENLPLVIAGAPGVDEAFYAPLSDGLPVRFGCTHNLMREARVAVVNSGTATLEAAVLHCPEVAVYHVGCSPWLEKCLRRLLFPKGFFFTLPNIIAGREVVKECIGYRFTVEQVSDELTRLLTDAPHRAAQRDAFQGISHALFTPSATAWKLIIDN